MYGVAGERRLPEFELPWLPGYEGSAPVRIGNAASEQLQVDVFGEVMDALYQARAHGLAKERRAWQLQRALLDHLERIWAEPDEGIWEIRGEPPALRALEGDGVGRVRPRRPLGRGAGARRPGRPVARAPRADPRGGVRARLRRRRSARSSSRTARRSSTRASCSSRSSASSPRTTRAYRARWRRSSASSSRRARPALPHAREGVDGLPAGEGVFLPCSFWLVDCYELLGPARRGARALRPPRSASRTTSACSPRSTTRRRSGCSATSRRRSRISRSSTPRSTCCRTCRRRCIGAPRAVARSAVTEVVRSRE